MIEVLEVLPAPGPEELLGSSIDAPPAGSSLDTYAIEVTGWAVGRHLPVAEVVLRSDGTSVSRVPVNGSRPDIAAAFPATPHAGSSGFRILISSLRLAPDFALVVEAVLRDGGRAQLATIRGRRNPLSSPFQPRLTPLIVTAPGRTGSTLLMRMLESHPAILTYRPFQYEARVASYWIGLLQALSEPESYLRQLSDARNLDQPSWWLGAGPPMPRGLPDGAIQEWMGGAAVGELAGFCQDRIESLYGRIASSRGREDAAYFAEKYIPGGVQALMWELYPDAREVILVRDFRDMLSSMFAFNEKRGVQGFRRARAESDHEYVIDTVGGSVSALVRDWEARSGRAHLVRYEDLVTSPAKPLAALLEYLGLEPDPAAVKAMAASAADKTPEMEWHQTTESPGSSIGRWRRDLSPELQVLCESAFGPALAAFGYEAGASEGDSRAEPYEPGPGLSAGKRVRQSLKE